MSNNNRQSPIEPTSDYRKSVIEDAHKASRLNQFVGQYAGTAAAANASAAGLSGLSEELYGSMQVMTETFMPVVSEMDTLHEFDLGGEADAYPQEPDYKRDYDFRDGLKNDGEISEFSPLGELELPLDRREVDVDDFTSHIDPAAPLPLLQNALDNDPLAESPAVSEVQSIMDAQESIDNQQAQPVVQQAASQRTSVRAEDRAADAHSKYDDPQTKTQQKLADRRAALRKAAGFDNQDSAVEALKKPWGRFNQALGMAGPGFGGVDPRSDPDALGQDFSSFNDGLEAFGSNTSDALEKAAQLLFQHAARIQMAEAVIEEATT